MAFLFYTAGLLGGLVAIICWIIVLISMFNEGVGTGIFGLICGLYALIWSWLNRDKVGGTLPVIWTLAIVIGGGLRGAAMGMGH